MNVLERNFFTDPELFQDPTPYYAALHEAGPVFREPHQGAFILSRISDILDVYADHEHFSAIVAPLGPLVPIPPPEPGETWAENIERRRDSIPMGHELTSIDPPRHTRHRAMAGKLFTPNRLKENEEFMWTLAEGLIDEMAERGEVEFCAAFARPFTLLVIADLLGVPREHHERFRSWLGGAGDTIGNAKGDMKGDTVFQNLLPYFTRYVEERRAEPRDDVLSTLAHVRFPDGELPEVIDVVRLAAILFAAGQETTARLIAAAMRILAERPDWAEDLRTDSGGIPTFVEDMDLPLER